MPYDYAKYAPLDVAAGLLDPQGEAKASPLRKINMTVTLSDGLCNLMWDFP